MTTKNRTSTEMYNQIKADIGRKMEDGYFGPLQKDGKRNSLYRRVNEYTQQVYNHTIGQGSIFSIKKQAIKTTKKRTKNNLVPTTAVSDRLKLQRLSSWKIYCSALSIHQKAEVNMLKVSYKTKMDNGIPASAAFTGKQSDDINTMYNQYRSLLNL